MSPYEQLEARFAELGHLDHAQAILHWDEAVMMPAEAGEARGAALATLAALAHRMLAAPEVAELLDRAEGASDELDAWQRANLREMRRAQVRATARPESLVRAKQVARIRCEGTWRRARERGDWTAVKRLLEDVLAIARDEAGALGERLGLDPYDALLDGFEPGLRAAEVARVFADLKSFLPDFLGRALERQVEPKPLGGPVPRERQRALAQAMMRALGFDFARGRLDVSHHPFCGGVPDDARITTRYSEDDFLESLMAVLHETGHALYQQGLPPAWRGQPVGAALGSSIHESQSLFVEMQVSRSRAFMQFAAPHIREHMGASKADDAWSPESLHARAIRVQPSLIRVDADEITYPLHVIFRFELEQQLIAGDLSVADIPDAWDACMTRYLGLSTRDDLKDGCMQDAHWFAGLFGYFPTYTLGALTAAQWFAAAARALPDIEERIASGDFAPLLDWLRTHVHARGRLLTAPDLIRHVTAEPLDTRFFKTHLERRYLQE